MASERDLAVGRAWLRVFLPAACASRSPGRRADVDDVSPVREEGWLTACVIAEVADALHHDGVRHANVETSPAALGTRHKELAPVRLGEVLLQQHGDEFLFLLGRGSGQQRDLAVSCY
jgi:hypothetical protein